MTDRYVIHLNPDWGHMTPADMVDAGIRALRAGETGHLTHEAAAHTALAWAALAEATVRVQAHDETKEGA